MYGEESLTKLNKIKRLDPAFEFQNLKHNKYKKRGWGTLWCALESSPLLIYLCLL